MINLPLATFGAGCFWCVEAIFQRVKGIEKVVSGYAGGEIDSPTYEQICTGSTGHAEVIQISFYPEVVSFVDLLQIFFKTHDPTTLNRQGNDTGSQYRSVIFYHSSAQRKGAEKVMADLNKQKIWPQPIVTEVSEAPIFYLAEKYHQNYFNSNPEQGYCQFNIVPKIEKLNRTFKEYLK